MKKAAKVYFTDFRCTGDENLQAKFTRLMKAAGMGKVTEYALAAVSGKPHFHLALDHACADLVNAAPVLPGSALDGVDTKGASDYVAFPFTPTVTLSHIDLPIVTSA